MYMITVMCKNWYPTNYYWIDNDIKNLSDLKHELKSLSRKEKYVELDEHDVNALTAKPSW